MKIYSLDTVFEPNIVERCFPIIYKNTYGYQYRGLTLGTVIKKFPDSIPLFLNDNSTVIDELSLNILKDNYQISESLINQFHQKLIAYKKWNNTVVTGCMYGEGNEYMIIHYLDSICTFPKHKGKKISEILQKDPSYINFCAVKIDGFLLSEHDIYIIMLKYPKTLTETALRNLKEKLYSLNLYNKKSKEEKAFEYQMEMEDEYYESIQYKDYFNSYNDDMDFDQQSLEFWNQF